MDLQIQKQNFTNLLPDDLKQWIKPDAQEMLIKFPVISYPEKVKSLKLEKVPEIEGVLTGIKGQYWMIDNSNVINIRSHTGFRVSLEF